MQYCYEENTDWWANASCTSAAKMVTGCNSLPIVTACSSQSKNGQATQQ